MNEDDVSHASDSWRLFFQDNIALQTSSESFASVPFISLNFVGSLDSSDK